MVNGTPGGGLWGDVRDTRRESSRFVARTGRGVAPNRRGRPLAPRDETEVFSEELVGRRTIPGTY